MPLGSPLAALRAARPLLPVLLLALAPSLAAQPADDPWSAFAAARALLAQALQHQQEPEMWSDVRPTTAEARAALAAVPAEGEGPLPARRAALEELLAAVEARQTATDARVQGQAERAGDPAGLASVEGRWATTAGQLADDLLVHEGALPELSAYAADLLVEAGRPAEAQRAFHHALVLWPAHPGVHAGLRAWVGRLPAPAQLVDTLQERVGRLGRNDPLGSGLALETSAALRLELGRRVYADAEASGSFDAYREAADHFEAAADDLARSRGMPRQLDASELAAQRAAALINAGWAEYAVAWGLWSAGEPDDPAAWDAAAASQLAFVEALRADPGNAQAKAGLSQLGTLVGTKGRDVDPLLLPPEDKAHIRDYFGELARFFDVAEWWNNHALFSRDTGEAADARGESDRARELYEQAYASYQRAIELTPNDARMVNDTGVMLYYYLQRDLDRAEELFRRAIELGEDVLDNPFADRGSDAWLSELAATLDAKLNLARLLADQGRMEQASEMIDAAVALDREVAEAGHQDAVRLDLLQTKARIDAQLDDGGS